MINLPYEVITGNTKPNVIMDRSDYEFYSGKTIVVTGAGGTIGSRIFHHLASVPFVKLIAVDHDENALHSLSLQTTSTALFEDSSMHLLDIRDYLGIERLFDEVRPDQVFHCAALKHLSILEKHPREAYLTNVQGTENLVRASDLYKVPGFLNISTDKAVQPTSILGLTKRVSELIVSTSRKRNGLRYTSVRFGNVFNSKGSVIETFAHQIQKGQNITLTDPMMMRYFMHIDEAACLAIKAAVINAGNIHILDMGKPIYLTDVISRMQHYFGTKLDVVITGRRQGEKLDEALMHEFEVATETPHPKIRAYTSNNYCSDTMPNIDFVPNEDLAKLLLNLIS
jgi:FlaA1/EpsC-like NDP-sugar epimerase